MSERKYGLGWIPNPDERNKAYSMSLALGDNIESNKPQTVIWQLGPILDQGQTNHCVGYAWKQWQQATPGARMDGPTADEIYYQCKVLDGEPNQEDGSTTQTGVKCMGREGRVQTYLWAFSLGTFRNWILTKGPIVVGTSWYDDMFTPDANNFVSVTGPLAGGHEYLCYGYDAVKKAFKFCNSWGTDWGDKGTFWVHEAEMNKLIWHNQDLPGDACAAIETHVKPISPGTATP